MTELLLDQDAMDAALDLVGRTGARGLEIGYVREGVPPEQAGWWATAQYSGAKVTEEEHRGPVEALEALARRLLTGAMCTHCRGLIALSDGGAMVYPGSSRPDGSTWTPEEVERVRNLPQCRYSRQGSKWVRGCTRTSRRERRAVAREQRKGQRR